MKSLIQHKGFLTHSSGSAFSSKLTSAYCLGGSPVECSTPFRHKARRHDALITEPRPTVLWRPASAKLAPHQLLPVGLLNPGCLAALRVGERGQHARSCRVCTSHAGSILSIRELPRKWGGCIIWRMYRVNKSKDTVSNAPKHASLSGHTGTGMLVNISHLSWSRPPSITARSSYSPQKTSPT